MSEIANHSAPRASGLPTTSGRRLGIVLSHPVQYYAPWFRFLAAAGWQIRVFYLWNFGVTARRDPGFDRVLRWDVDLISGYEHEFVRNWSPSPGTHRLTGLFNPGLVQRIEAWGPAALLVFGYKYLTQLQLINQRRWPLVFRGDSHLLGHPPPRGLKHWMLSRIYARFDAVTYVGQANRAYFRAFGVPDGKLHFAPHCVDATHFAPTETLIAQAAALKASLGLADHRIVLYAGKLVESKQPQALLQAFLQLSPNRVALVFVGDGPERASLQALAATRPDVTVRFLPFANQSEMPVRYLLADLFTLPSIGLAETWGLAVTEAMHMGVPCLVSDRVGCQQDLVTDGETGWVFRADSLADLRVSLERALLDLQSAAPRFRQAAQRRVAGYSFAAAATGLESAVAGALGCRHMN